MSSHRGSRSWRLGCPGTFPIHKNVLLLPGRRSVGRSRKGRESPGLSKFLLLLLLSVAVAAVLLSSTRVRLITLSTALSYSVGTVTPDLRSGMLSETLSYVVVVKPSVFLLCCRHLRWPWPHVALSCAKNRSSFLSQGVYGRNITGCILWRLKRAEIKVVTSPQSHFEIIFSEVVLT